MWRWFLFVLSDYLGGMWSCRSMDHEMLIGDAEVTWSAQIMPVAQVQ